MANYGQAVKQYRDTHHVEPTGADRLSSYRFGRSSDIWMTNSQGYCYFLNPEWTQFTGQEQADGFGTGWLKMVHRDDRQPSEDKFAEPGLHRSPVGSNTGCTTTEMDIVG